MKKISKKWGWVFAMILFLWLTFGITAAQASSLYEYYNTGGNSFTAIYGWQIWKAQTFTVGAVGHTVTSVKLKLFRSENPGTFTVSIRATDGSGHPMGSDLTSGSMNGNSLITSTLGAWYEIVLTELSLSANTKYAIVVRVPSGDTDNNVHWKLDSTSPTYVEGNEETSNNEGGTWSSDTGSDFMFEVWSGGLPPPPPNCGNGALDIGEGEQCDPPFDAACPGQCHSNCTCPTSSSVGLINPLFCKDIPCVIDAIINFIFYLGITIFTLMIIIGGIMYITSAGDPQKISTAKRLLLWTVIGLAIILLAKGLISLIRSVLGGG
jgi:hypothetical protein